jgi:hypothetical protein
MQAGRLLNGSPNPLTRRLLQAGLRDSPPPRAFSATAAALGIATPTAAAASATAAAAARATFGAARLATTKPAALLGVAFLKWVGFGAIIGTLSSAALFTVFEANPPPSTAPASLSPVIQRSGLPKAGEARFEAPTTVQVAPSSARREPTPAAPVGEPSTMVRREAAASPSSADNFPAADVSQGAGTQSQLARETLLIDRARLELARGNLAAGSRLLREYDAIRSIGVLDREARFLGVEIAARQGDRGRASALAQQFEQQFPGDSYLPRLRRLLAGIPP